MFFHFLPQFQNSFSELRVFEYITFRTAGASLTALILGLVLGPWMIRRLRDFQVGQVVRQDGPAEVKVQLRKHAGVLGHVSRFSSAEIECRDSTRRRRERREGWIERGVGLPV